MVGAILSRDQRAIRSDGRVARFAADPSMSPKVVSGSGSIRTVAALGTAQTLAWASSYYLPAMLAAPMARDLGVSTPTVFAAFSIALIVTALVGPWSGHMIDRHGGRPVLMGTNLVFAAGLALLAFAQG